MRLFLQPLRYIHRRGKMTCAGVHVSLISKVDVALHSRLCPSINILGKRRLRFTHFRSPRSVGASSLSVCERRAISERVNSYLAPCISRRESPFGVSIPLGFSTDFSRSDETDFYRYRTFFAQKVESRRRPGEAVFFFKAHNFSLSQTSPIFE